MTDKWDRKTGFCCRTCAYYVPKAFELGRCRRHAPTMAGYPVVYANSDWCGEHKIGTNPSKEAEACATVLSKEEEICRKLKETHAIGLINGFGPEIGGARP